MQISGRGPSGNIVFIEDYPSEEEFKQCKPLIGANFNMIKNLCANSREHPDNFYRTCFCKDRNLDIQTQIRRNKVKWNSKVWLEHKEYFQSCLDQIIQELIEIKPRMIVITGELPLNSLCERRKIRKYRGSVLELADWVKIAHPYLAKTLVVPIIPLRDLYIDQQYQVFTQLDLEKAIKYAREPFVHPDKKYMLSICYTASDFFGFIDRTKHPKFRTIDIETNNSLITCIGFCLDGQEAISIPFIGLNKDEAPLLWKAIAKYLYKEIPTVGQNFVYDSTILESLGFEWRGFYGDTMLLAHTLYPEFPKGLDFLTSIYTDLEYYKDDVKDISGLNYDPEKYRERLYLYNAKDALTTHIIYSQQLEDAKELKVLDFYNERVVPLFFCYKKLQNTGILVDESKRQSLIIKYKIKLESSLDHLKRSIEPDDKIEWNTFVNSPKQVAYLVYDYLACPEITHWTVDSKTGERRQVLSTDEESLEELILNRISNDAIKKVLYSIIVSRKYFKILSWLSTPYDYNGKMYTSYNQVGCESGRSSASERPDKFRILRDDENNNFYKEPVGYSFQTIPKHGYELPDGSRIGGDLLEIFIPHDGNIFIEGDKSQAEARVVTVLSENYKLLPVFDNPPGIHRLTASWIVGGDPFKIDKKSDAYDKGKRARHAGNYGMGPGRLSIMTHLSFKECELILFKFHRADPTIQGVFQHEVKRALHDTHVLISPHGRRREFFGRLDENSFKEGYAQIPQATVSDDVKDGLRLMMKDAPWADYLIEKHDSILAEIPKNRLDNYVPIWKKNLERGIDFRKCSLSRDFELVIPTELQTSESNLSELKDLK